jgi:acetoacetyl-CoA synthetase
LIVCSRCVIWLSESSNDSIIDVWSHGDLITIHPITRQITFLGRADGVLNPSGVRFGSAEIYSIIETDFPQVEDSICVGRRRQQDPDESVILFLKMKQGELFTEELATNVKHVIRKKRTARHVPKFILPTPEIPVNYPQAYGGFSLLFNR